MLTAVNLHSCPFDPDSLISDSSIFIGSTPPGLLGQSGSGRSSQHQEPQGADFHGRVSAEGSCPLGRHWNTHPEQPAGHVLSAQVRPKHAGRRRATKEDPLLTERACRKKLAKWRILIASSEIFWLFQNLSAKGCYPCGIISFVGQESKRNNRLKIPSRSSRVNWGFWRSWAYLLFHVPSAVRLTLLDLEEQLWPGWMTGWKSELISVQ